MVSSGYDLLELEFTFPTDQKNLCGDRIRIERLKKRMTQMELAAKIQLQGITLERDSISRIEIGTRFVTDYELKLFAKVLNVTVDDLLEEDDTMES